VALLRRRAINDVVTGGKFAFCAIYCTVAQPCGIPLSPRIGSDASVEDLKQNPNEEGRQITPPRSVPYDTLVIAVGSITNDFGTPGAAQHAVPLETTEQAVRFNHRLVNACIRANAQEEPVRPGQLHVAIIGAGATGTELAAELYRTTRQVVSFGLDRVDPAKDIRIILIEAAPPHSPRAARTHLGSNARTAKEPRR
jgi:NADH:ubiquinone reductase (H+-translocating)